MVPAFAELVRQEVPRTRNARRVSADENRYRVIDDTSLGLVGVMRDFSNGNRRRGPSSILSFSIFCLRTDHQQPSTIERKLPQHERTDYSINQATNTAHHLVLPRGFKRQGV